MQKNVPTRYRLCTKSLQNGLLMKLKPDRNLQMDDDLANVNY